jgi:flagellar biosynthesis protein FliR
VDAEPAHDVRHLAAVAARQLRRTDDLQLSGSHAAALFAGGIDGLGDWLLSTLLLSLRLGVAVAMSPALSSYGVPAMVRVALVFALSALTLSSPVAPAPDAALLQSPQGLLAAGGAELFLGMLLGLGGHVVLAAFAVAGRILDVQIGFGIGSIFDPVTRASQNVMGSLMSLLGVTLFFVTDAHLALAGMLAGSLSLFPLGKLPAIADPMPIVSAAGSMFAMGLALAAPVAIALMLTDLFVGMTSRNMPQINVLVLSIPLKVLIAYFILALSVRAWSPTMDRMFAIVGDILGAR